MAFECPRCHTSVDDRFYGPCTVCRSELRAQQRTEARDVGDTSFVPAMNVTPNAVALKE